MMNPRARPLASNCGLAERDGSHHPQTRPILLQRAAQDLWALPGSLPVVGLDP